MPLKDFIEADESTVCSSCGRRVPTFASHCPFCGEPLHKRELTSKKVKKKAELKPKVSEVARKIAGRKNPTLAFVLGLVFLGLGHIYVRRRKEGAFYVLVGLVFYTIMFLGIRAMIMGGVSGIEDIITGEYIFTVLALILLVVLVVYTANYARKLAHEYNASLMSKGSPPW